MKNIIYVAATAVFLCTGMAHDDPCILKAQYIAAEGTDIEHGQGAIERNQLEHAPLDPVTWLILVPEAGDPGEWERKLNATVDRKLGSFKVGRPTAEDTRRLETGEIAFQQ